MNKKEQEVEGDNGDKKQGVLEGERANRKRKKSHGSMPSVIYATTMMTLTSVNHIIWYLLKEMMTQLEKRARKTKTTARKKGRGEVCKRGVIRSKN